MLLFDWAKELCARAPTAAGALLSLLSYQPRQPSALVAKVRSLFGWPIPLAGAATQSAVPGTRKGGG
jgi:hypothetical protein